MRRVLITGAAGFIGSNLTNRCLAQGFHVTGVDDMSNGNEEFLKPEFVDSDEFLVQDFTDSYVLSKIRKQEFDVVVHLAATPRVSYSVEHPLQTHDNNVTKTLNLLDACRGNVSRVVFASSSSVYGGADVLPTPTSHPKNPKSPYALQKSIIEDYLRLYSDLYGLDSVALRFFNVFGPNQMGNSPYSTAVSAWLTAIKSGKSMRVDGDGSQSRDMCYVDNVVDACVRSIETPHLLRGEPLNVACGDSTTNAEILSKLKEIYPDASSHFAPARIGDVKHTRADVSRTFEVLGYRPIVRFWEGLNKTIEWHEATWDKIKDV